MRGDSSRQNERNKNVYGTRHLEDRIANWNRISSIIYATPNRNFHSKLRANLDSPVRDLDKLILQRTIR